ncbi:MAG: hypothetical protein LUE91_03390 [Oscillospiraceae bacterium]|nr:hypothetical protein [Oscillospiraceae bacterium]
MTNEERILEALEQQGNVLEQMNEHLNKVDSRLDKMDGRMDRMESDISGIKVRLDVEVRNQFALLAENQQIMMEKLERLDDMEVMDTRITALEAMVKKLNRDVEKLRRAQ